MKKPTLEDTVETDLAPHEVLLSFDKNDDADEFRDWWESEGWQQFHDWNAKKK